MMSIRVRNVNEALAALVNTLRSESAYIRKVSPRGIETHEFVEPFATTYWNPMERVLFDPVRNANPFFHIMEAMWMLAGRNDVGFPARFLPKFTEYSDNGKSLHGAYGYRWFSGLRWTTRGQVGAVIDELARDGDSRRAVIAMWQPTRDMGYTGKDMPCNCTVTFKIRDDKLNMTVFNRSNDAIWGAYGANAVQFSFLLEYMAKAVNVQPGMYVQISDSMHVYPNVKPYPELMKFGSRYMSQYDSGGVKPMDMFDNTTLSQWETDLDIFFQGVDTYTSTWRSLRTPWFVEVLVPLYEAHMLYKMNELDYAIKSAKECIASDWSLACVQWLERIVTARAAK